MNKDILTWDEYFMGVALFSANRSKDPNTQVGACIVNDEHKIVSVGYNGMPTGCDDSKLPWSRESDNTLNTKYPYVCHAELNAILNSNQMSLKGCTLYVTLFPCNECAKAVIQSGIKRVVYLSDKYNGTISNTASKTLLRLADVECVPYVLSDKTITINL
jgi:dCMP deaminase